VHAADTTTNDHKSLVRRFDLARGPPGQWLWTVYVVIKNDRNRSVTCYTTDDGVRSYRSFSRRMYRRYGGVCTYIHGDFVLHAFREYYRHTVQYRILGVFSMSCLGVLHGTKWLKRKIKILVRIAAAVLLDFTRIYCT